MTQHTTLARAAETVANIAAYVRRFQNSRVKLTNKELNAIIERCQKATAQIGEAMSQIEASTHTPVYCTVSDAPGQGANRWLARILVLGQEPFDFVPDRNAYVLFKGDLVLLVNKAHPGVVYVSEETFNWASESSRREDRQP